MLDIDLGTWRVFVHVLAASLWIGGQLTLAALVPVLRSIDVGAPRQAARRFNQIAWPAYAVLVVTGVWNIVEEREEVHGRYGVALTLKVVIVVASGLAAFWHTRAGTPSRVAVLGALSAVFGLAALFLGIVLAG